ncbi:MAG: LysM domain-containing protein [Flexilinea sp.]
MKRIYREAVLFLCLICCFLSAADNAPQQYVVESGDTFSAIAFQYGLTMDQLQAANPKIDPVFLQIGDELIIPPNETGAYDAFIQEMYSAYVQNNGIECFTSPVQSVSCIARILNPGDDLVTNVFLKIDLTDSTGQHIELSTGTPLSQLLPGEEIPVLFYSFDSGTPPFATNFSVTNLDVFDSKVNSFRLPEDQWEHSVSISADRLSAAVRIQILQNPELTDSDKGFTILAAAYRTDGSPEGIRSWNGSGTSEINLTVYSLSDPIDSVKIWVEAY